MQNTILILSDKLPLTCSRAGACCHGNKVLLNPWELACLSSEKELNIKEFRDSYSENGVRLRFDGAIGYSGKKACNLYVEGEGCSVHVARPLACRLFPLGRQIQNGETVYMHQGNEFPCLDGCSEVLNLPYCSVNEYLIGQETEKWEKAQNAYLELVQLLADIAFELLLDNGLVESGDTETLQQWRLMANELPEQLIERIGEKWFNNLTAPAIDPNKQDDPQMFCEQHIMALQEQLQNSFGSIQTIGELREAAVLTMSLALLLAIAVGADAQLLATHWIDVAKKHGAQG